MRHGLAKDDDRRARGALAAHPNGHRYPGGLAIGKVVDVNPKIDMTMLYHVHIRKWLLTIGFSRLELRDDVGSEFLRVNKKCVGNAFSAWHALEGSKTPAEWQSEFCLKIRYL